MQIFRFFFFFLKIKKECVSFESEGNGMRKGKKGDEEKK